ncbi:LptF/LptG family permease [Vaginella massiliensis]|uniref:LptF/LptG family permease n=1 Tax=Vaginella massiliensis TaxID=1816680 RepID=UPI0008393830|nr:LptF/LptG family permease [Vaginella massiliensis]
MKIIDKYIARNFIGTFFFMVLILSSIAIIIDLSQKLDRINSTGSSAWEALIQFYPFWAIWIINTFLPVAVFISVIYFTSRLTAQTEIVAIQAGGISFFRITRPYIIVASLLAFTAMMVNNIVLPWANVKKNAYQYVHLLSNGDRESYYKRQIISSQISKNEYVFVESYDRTEKLGNTFTYQRFDSITMKEQILASSFDWSDEDSAYLLRNVHQRYIINPQKDSIFYFPEKKLKLSVTPDELLPEGYVAETMNSFELQRFIDSQKSKGSANVVVYENELHARISSPFSTFILTILALSLSSKKRRGGIGINLAVGVTLAFVYIFFSQVSKTFSEQGYMSSFAATWIPNVVFGFLTLWLYFKRAKS